MDKEISFINKHKTFIILEDHESLLPGDQKIPYHLIFDAKFDGRKKELFVARGHKAPEVPQTDVYSGVVSIETLRLDFMLATITTRKCV